MRKAPRPLLATLVTLGLLTAGQPHHAAPSTTTDLLTFIRALEAPRGYDDYERRIPIPPPRPLTQMTVAEVLAWQRRVRAADAISSAAGGYQIIYKTLNRLVDRNGIDRAALFDARMQDRLARLLISECGRLGPPPEHRRYADCLAGIWAALPLTSGPKRGESAYRHIAGNRARTTPETVLALLQGEVVALETTAPRAATPTISDEAVFAFGAIRLNRCDISAANTLTPSVRSLCRRLDQLPANR